MNTPSRRPLSLTNLRAFETVARLLSFSEAADELFVTQSAVSRQIKGLEEELGASLFTRGTRHVELTVDGQALLRVVAPWLARLDAGVREIREQRGRRRVNLSTFASFASLWLLPRIEAFQREHPDIDIRMSAQDAMVDLDDPEIDVVLRHCRPVQAPPGARRLFGEALSPVISGHLAERIARGEAPPLKRPADLAQHTLAEVDDYRPSAELLSWRHWLGQHGEPALQPRRWLTFNYTFQQVQAALTGQGVALARIALVTEALRNGELVEPFGAEGRLAIPYAYWLVAPAPGSGMRPEVARFCGWVEAQGAATRAALGEEAGEEAGGPGEGD